MRVNHDIFTTPHNVELSLEARKTPEVYRNHEEHRDLPETLPMWRVQTEGYTEGTDQLVGVVSRDAGFFDSPDTEWISGGVNSKGLDAVAIGRHGNFFHWGFAASPTYMTEEAKLVFVNAVHYIAKFDGQAPVARKVQGTVLRSSLKRSIYATTDEGYAEVLKRYAGYRKDDVERKAKLQARKDAGETLSTSEERSLAAGPVTDPGRFDSLGRYLKDSDWEAIKAHPDGPAAALTADLGYLRPSGEWYQLIIDQDLKALGWANHDPQFLTRAVSALDSPELQEVALRLLQRYSLQSFTTESEWQTWLSDHAGRFFFSESAGYKWLVNAQDLPWQGPQDERVLAAVTKQDAWVPSAAQPLVCRALVDQVKGMRRVRLQFKILEGWHSYAIVPKGSAYPALTVGLGIKEPSAILSPWILPELTEDPTTPGLMILSGEFEYSCFISKIDLSKGPTTATCEVRYQVCNDELCREPQTLTLDVEIR